MKLNNIKRLVKEDFSKDDRELIDKLSFALNPFLEQIGTIFNKNVDFDNLNQEIVNIPVEVDSLGVPKTQTVVKTTLKTKIKGAYIIRADNLENDGTFPSGAPFITYSFSGNIITVLHVTGLPANKRYSLNTVFIG